MTKHTDTSRSGDLVAAMKDQIESWEFEDPRETWWKWQHQYAQAADLIETQAREIERLREALQREEYGHRKSIEERDYAEEYISRIYRTVTGKTAEWSNLFGFAEALDDIRAALGDNHDQ